MSKRIVLECSTSFFFFFKVDLDVKITSLFFRVTPRFRALAKDIFFRKGGGGGDYTMLRVSYTKVLTLKKNTGVAYQKL